jgi:hypothetical protein
MKVKDLHPKLHIAMSAAYLELGYNQNTTSDFVYSQDPELQELVDQINHYLQVLDIDYTVDQQEVNEFFFSKDTI